MKISNDHHVQVNTTIRQDTSVTQGPTPAFATVLEKAFDKPDVEKKCSPIGVPPVLKPPIEISTNHVYSQTNRLMKAMETYQALLSDNHASLRSMEPAVREMKIELSSLQGLMNEMPETHPMYEIVSETIQVGNGEIARFDSGLYIEDADEMI